MTPPCVKCGATDRGPSTPGNPLGVCRPCRAEYNAKYRASPEGKAALVRGQATAKAYRAAHREESRAYHKAWNASPEGKARQKARNVSPEVKARNKAWNASPEGKAWRKDYSKAYDASPERKAYLRAQYRVWKATPEGRATVNANSSRRNASKLNATPVWPGIWDTRKATAGWYRINSPGQHVDHVIPLKGRTVTGLHVIWNLRAIPAAENVAKGNRFDQDAVNSDYLAVIADREWNPRPISPAQRRTIQCPLLCT